MKRKGTDFLNSSYISVGHNTSFESTMSSWEETRAKMKAMRAKTCSTTSDNILESIQRCSDYLGELHSAQQELTNDALHIKNQLQTRIELAREACKEESDDLYNMQRVLQQLQMDRDALVESLGDLDETTSELNSSIHALEAECSETIESIDAVEAERMRAVPRLKQQISLYATTTSIKWNFDEEDMLVGHLVVSKTGGIRKFRIDPKEYSDFEIANHLWSLMETGTYQGEIDNGGGKKIANE